MGTALRFIPVFILFFLLFALDRGQAEAYSLDVGDIVLTYNYLGDDTPVYGITVANNVVPDLSFSDYQLLINGSLLATGTLNSGQTIDLGPYVYGSVASISFTATAGSITNYDLGGGLLFSSGSQTISATLIPTEVPDNIFDIALLSVNGEITETQAPPVPEPGTLALLAVGMGGVLLWRRSRTR